MAARHHVAAAKELSVGDEDGDGLTRERHAIVDGDATGDAPVPPPHAIGCGARHNHVDRNHAVIGLQCVERYRQRARGLALESHRARHLRSRRDEVHERAAHGGHRRRERGVVAGNLELRRLGRGLAPRLALGDHAATAPAAATTPREQASAAARATAAVAGFGATSAI